jgi:DNA-binding response OmpR family regulator
MPLKIVVIEDDAILREELSHFLRGNAFEVDELITGPALDDLLNEKFIDLIILDLNLPGPNGFEIATKIKSKYPNIGIVMLTARTSLPDRVKSYDSGADIYLPKPTSSAEVLAAINSLGRRLVKNTKDYEWKLDTIRGMLLGPASSQRIILTTIEQNLLTCLARAPNMIMDIESLCENLSKISHDHVITKRALENLISRFRKKAVEIAQTENDPIIRSVRGLGYQLCVPVSIVSSG